MRVLFSTASYGFTILGFIPAIEAIQPPEIGANRFQSNLPPNAAISVQVDCYFPVVGFPGISPVILDAPLIVVWGRSVPLEGPIDRPRTHTLRRQGCVANPRG